MLHYISPLSLLTVIIEICILKLMKRFILFDFVKNVTILQKVPCMYRKNIPIDTIVSVLTKIQNKRNS